MRRLRFKRLTVANFRSFVAKQSIELDAGNGLVLIAGDNQVDSRLGGNGCGKSTLFDAISFAFFGKTSTGVKSPDLKNWDHEGKSFVQLDFSIDKTTHCLRREIKPNFLELDGTEVSQDELDNLLGISHEMFMVTVLHGQNSIRFLDLSPALQLEYFTSLLDLDLYTRAGKYAGKEADTIADMIEQIEKKIIFDLSSSIEMERQLEELQEKEVKWLRERINIVSDLKRELAKIRRQIKHTEAIDDQVEPIDTKYYEAALRMERKDRQYLEAVTSDIKEVERKLARLKKAASNLGYCELCGQELPNADEAMRHNNKKTKALLVELRDLQDQEDRARASLKASSANLEKQLRRLEQVKAKENKEAVSKQANLARLRNIEARQEEEIAKWFVSTTPYEDDIAKVLERIIENKEKVRIGRESVIEYKEGLAELQYWEKGFKDLRLKIVDTALEQMTFRSNAVLHDLGMTQWKISVQAESFNKSGSVRRSMRILAGKEELKPIGCFSGGETQRLRLAVAIGFSDLVLSIKGISSNIELWDEPSSWLSQRGVQDLLDVLSERSELEQKRIFIADHRSLEYSFADIVMVTKTEAGSQLATE